MGSKHFSRKQRQLRYLVKKLNILMKQTDSDLKSDIIKMTVKKGDTVLYGKYSGTEVSLDGGDFVIMRESDILAVL